MLSLEPPPTDELDAPSTEETKEDEVEIYQDILDVSPIDQDKCFTLVPTPLPETEQAKIEFKILLQKLKYEFLNSEFNCLVIVNVDLGRDEIEKLLAVLKRYFEATIYDPKGISPSVYAQGFT